MKKFLVFLAAISLVFGIGGMASANLITNGSFENSTDDPSVGYITLSNGSTAIPGWTVHTSVDWIGDYWQASDGSWSLDLAGDMPGWVWTDFQTTPGEWYRVEFDMAGNPDRDYDKALLGVAVVEDSGDYINGEEFIFEQGLGTHSNMGWLTKSFDFQAVDELTRLFFGDSTDEGGPWGAAIDNVRVAPVPEPATMLLLGSGLIGLAAFRRRFIKR